MRLCIALSATEVCGMLRPFTSRRFPGVYEHQEHQLAQRSSPYAMAEEIEQAISDGNSSSAAAAIASAADCSREALSHALERAACALRSLSSEAERVNLGNALINSSRAQHPSLSLVREAVSECLAQRGDYTFAAQTLASSDFDSSELSGIWRFNACVRCAMLFLEDNEHVQAESMISKASSLSHMCPDTGSQLQFKMSYARVLDAKRRFLEAALQYYDVSQHGRDLVEQGTVDEAELTTALDEAILCTLIANVGPQKARNLNMLYKDDRCTKCSHFHLLEKVYFEQMLRPPDVDGLKQVLKKHQLAVGSDGLTVADKAITEHNIVSASKLYRNIRSAELGRVLNVSAEQAEKAVARLIADSKLTGALDQMNGLVRFDTPSGVSQPQYEAVAEHFDEQVRQVCLKANDAVGALHREGLYKC
jgi:COP9 signalosome complex subunit 4